MGLKAYAVFKFIYGARVEQSPVLPLQFIGLLHQPWMIDGDDCVTFSGMNHWPIAPALDDRW
jgi:hypothetical protein